MPSFNISSIAEIVFKLVGSLFSSSAFLCKASNGNLYGYQTEQTSSSLNVYRFDVETGLTEMVMGYSNLGGNAIRLFNDIKGSAMDDQGHMFAIARYRTNDLIPYYLKTSTLIPFIELFSIFPV